MAATHDSIVMAVPCNANVTQVKALVRDCLVERNDPAFGLSIKIKVGENWADAQE